jgi:hypothetical protein
LSEISELSDLISKIPPDLKPLDTFNKTNIDNPNTAKYTNSKFNLDIKLIRPRHWLIGIGVLLVISLITLKSLRRHFEADLYKEIVANSYDGGTELDIYVEKFYRDLEFYGIFQKKPKNIIVKFSNLEQIENTTHIHGMSFGHDDDNRIEIYVNPYSWKKFNKPMKYFLMYHELSHDVLNLDDLDPVPSNEGKLMYPKISSYEKKTMDDFIDSFHSVFEELSKN